MIGDKDLQIFQEQNSIARAPKSCRASGTPPPTSATPSTFVAQPKYPVTDDHIPLLQAGLRVIDVIDLDYGPENHSYHHTLADTMDKISASSLQIVGDVATALVTAQ